MSTTLRLLLVINEEIRVRLKNGLTYNAARRLVYEKYKERLEEIKNAKKY